MNDTRHLFTLKDLLVALCLAIGWSVFMFFLAYSEVREEHEQTRSLMLFQSQAFFQEVVTTRAWNAGHGGVYVFVTGETQPNPYLDDPQRELTLDDGRVLTKINPAYMTRQIAEYADQRGGVRFHITSLDPIRPQNAPDDWERAALEKFEQGAEETFEQIDAGDEPVFRYMAPLMVTEACMPCHAKQGYEVGHIRGGISVTLPAAQILAITNKVVRNHKWTSFFTWLLGMAAISAIINYYVKRRHAAEIANKTKSRFLASMSHEIRTPLNGVLGMLQLLQESGLKQEQQGYVDDALWSGRGLLELINDILDLSKIEADKLEVREDIFSLGEITESVLAMFRDPCPHKRSVALETAYAPETPGRIKTDQLRLRQILFNLVGNAVKFTDQGSIIVTVGVAEKHGDTKAVLEFSVTDTGMGISQERLADIFEPFTQDHTLKARQHQGTGLGLSIVKRLVQAMGGEISIASSTSEGSSGTTVTFTLPVGLVPNDMTRPDDARREPICPEPGELSVDKESTRAEMLERVAFSNGKDNRDRFRILVAEDDLMNQQVLKSMVLALGFHVECVLNGQDAIDRLRAETFDMVLMDIGMPVLDGVEATKRIRSDISGDFDPQLPIVAVSAHVMHGDEDRCIAAGMDEYIAKPVDFKTLTEVLQRYEAGSARS
ncbi:MAG: DUF3365 domain-containing protein [Desulfovibrio sp.]|nr:MAG: DUF3365 domain-containing protein [Desulfovibrio sp.]